MAARQLLVLAALGAAGSTPFDAKRDEKGTGMCIDAPWVNAFHHDCTTPSLKPTDVSRAGGRAERACCRFGGGFRSDSSAAIEAQRDKFARMARAHFEKEMAAAFDAELGPAAAAPAAPEPSHCLSRGVAKALGGSAREVLSWGKDFSRIRGDAARDDYDAVVESEKHLGPHHTEYCLGSGREIGEGAPCKDPERIARYLEPLWRNDSRPTLVYSDDVPLSEFVDGLFGTAHSLAAPRKLVLVTSLNENWGPLSTEIPNRTATWGKGEMCGGDAASRKRLWRARRFMDLPSVAAVFVSQHACVSHPKLRAFPLGVGGASRRGPLLAAAAVAARRNAPRGRELLVDNSGWKHRADVNAAIVSRFPGLRNEYKPGSGAASGRSYARASDAKFALAPSGLGYDSYRVWETMTLGAIPVIERSRGAWDDLFVDLPAVLVDSYDDVTPALLEAEYAHVMRHCETFNFAKLTVSYWIRMLRDPRGALR